MSLSTAPDPLWHSAAESASCGELRVLKCSGGITSSSNRTAIGRVTAAHTIKKKFPVSLAWGCYKDNWVGYTLDLLPVLWHYGEDTFPLLTGHLDSSNRMVMPFPFGLWMMATYPEFKRGFNSGICSVLKKCDNRAMTSLRHSGA